MAHVTVVFVLACVLGLLVVAVPGVRLARLAVPLRARARETVPRLQREIERTRANAERVQASAQRTGARAERLRRRTESLQGSLEALRVAVGGLTDAGRAGRSARATFRG
jgi:hypothetical protein